MKLQYVMIAMAAILGTAAAAEARDVASGLPTGKRMHKPFVVAKESAARINKSKSNVKNNY